VSLPTITSAAIEKARDGFKERGESQMAFARKHGLDYNTLSMVLQGRLKGYRGEARRCMIALGFRKEVK
jgi:gp16 family phage-associated protein